MLIISTSLEFEQLQKFKTCEAAPEIWKRLKIIHEQRSAINKVTLKQQFINCELGDGDSIAKYLSTIELMIQTLSDVGENVNDIDKNHIRVL